METKNNSEEQLKECKIKCETEKRECRIECADDDDREYKIGGEDDSHSRKIRLHTSVVWAILILLIFLNVTVVVWAVYEIVHVSGVSDLSGIHLTPSVKKAADSLMNKN